MKHVYHNTETGAYRVSEPPADERENWERVEVETLDPAVRTGLKVEKLSEDITRKLAALEKRLDETNARTLGAAQTADAKPKPISLCRLFRAAATGDWSKAEYEREVVSSPEARALSASVDTAGGYMVPSQYLADEFVPLLRSNTVLDKIGAKFLTGLRGSPINIPKQSSGATAYWVAEAASITDSTQGTSMISLTPRKLAGMTKVSNELLLQATPSAEEFVRTDLAAVLARALDLAAFKGSGASGQPLGVYYQTTAINTNSATTGSVGTVWDMIYANEADNVDMNAPSCGIVCHPNAWNVLRKAATDAGYPKSYGGAGYTLLEEAVGLPVYKSSQLGTNDVLVGKFDDLIVAEWAGMNFLASQHAGDAFQYDQTWMRATMLVDIAVRHSQSFCLNTVFGT